MRKVFVFVPAFGHMISATTFMTTHNLQQALASKAIGSNVATMSFPDIAELRSMAVTAWYDTMPDVSHLLFIDADMGFSPDMVLDMIQFDEPLVGAIYRQRNDKVSWAGSGSGGATTERRSNFMRVEGVGMGCTLIRRDVIATMLEKMPELVDNRIDKHPAAEIMRNAGTNRIIRAFEKMDFQDRGILSEDLSFCVRWNQCGGQVWAAIGYNISHVGPYDYAGCYLRHIESQQAQGILPQQSPAALPVSTPAPEAIPVDKQPMQIAAE